MKIDIGAGTLLQPGWMSLDPVHGKDDWRRYAQDTPWPADDNSIDALRASHVMEHIQAGPDRINVMNEAWRVLAPTHYFEIIVPCVMVNDEPVKGWWAWADPGHVSFWCYPQSWLYFTGEYLPNADY